MTEAIRFKKSTIFGQICIEIENLSDNHNMKKSNKIFLRTALPTKVTIVILIGLITKLFFSCTPRPPIDMHYNSINIIGVDNSDRFLKRYTSVDTMYSGAVALKLTLSDSTLNYYALNYNNVLKSLSFTPAMAFSYEENFIPVNKVEQIKITTIFDIDENARAGDDISNLMVYETGNDFELYKNLNNAIKTLNGMQATTSRSIVMVLKKSTENTKAQFNVQVTLDNGIELSFLTSIFTIMPQHETNL